jgi:hypothetical protein
MHLNIFIIIALILEFRKKIDALFAANYYNSVQLLIEKISPCQYIYLSILG